MNKFPADVVRRFNDPAGRLYRAFDHLIGARKGMTLMVPIVTSVGKLDDLVDQCPVPLLEASAILAADYELAEPLDMLGVLSEPFWKKIKHFAPLQAFWQELTECYFGDGGVHAHDQHWRHIQIRLSAGGEPCRVLIGVSGVRLAFTPDLFGEFL
jgi:hypothetical protein